jgi:hypothetical protein
MTRKEQLTQLAERVQGLAGPDREVDAKVAAATRTGLPKGCDWAFRFPKWEGEKFGEVRLIGNVNGNGDYIAGRFTSPIYTASLDVAISLVPEGWTYEARQGPSGFPHIWDLLTIACGDVRYTRVSGRGRTPALALAAAALLALAEQEA